MNFADKAPTRKGTLGEQIADRYLVAKGFIPYRPILENVAHPFDRLVASLDKRSIFVSNTKSKAQREFYPEHRHRCAALAHLQIHDVSAFA